MDCHFKMPFGRYKGRAIDRVPAEHLLKAYELGIREDYPEVHKFVEDNKWRLWEELEESILMKSE